MRHRLISALLVATAALCFGFQQQEGQATRCDNYKKTPAAHRCHCAHAEGKCPMPQDPPTEPGPKCSTYCRTSACHCVMPCAGIT